MNFKKVLAGVAAGSMVAAMSVTAFAEDCSYIDGKTSSYTYTVQGDVSTITADIVYAPDQEDGSFNFNDWCGNGVIVTLADGTKTYYQWGGAQVTWGWDADGDEVDDSLDGVKGSTWLGTVTDGKATLSIPVAQGATVDFLTLGWDSYAGVQYSVTVSEGNASQDDGDVAPVAYLAAVVALAGVAMVASKKARA
jgi:hypothetical protein